MTHTDDARRPLDPAQGRPHDLDPAELQNPEVAHEHSDVNIRGILLFAVGLVIVAAVVHILMWGMFRWLDNLAKKDDPQISPLAERAPDMPRTTTESPFFGHARGGAQLLTNEPMALQKLREEESKRLRGYGWVEGKPGVAYMPLDEAKKLILERGLPVRAGEPVDPTVGTRAQAFGEASSGRTIPIRKKRGEAPAGATSPAQPPGRPPATPQAAPGHAKH